MRATVQSEAEGRSLLFVGQECAFTAHSVRTSPPGIPDCLWQIKEMIQG